jgi:hypothetical protein
MLTVLLGYAVYEIFQHLQKALNPPVIEPAPFRKGGESLQVDSFKLLNLNSTTQLTLKLEEIYLRRTHPYEITQVYLQSARPLYERGPAR